MDRTLLAAVLSRGAAAEPTFAALVAGHRAGGPHCPRLPLVGDWTSLHVAAPGLFRAEFFLDFAVLSDTPLDIPLYLALQLAREKPTFYCRPFCRGHFLFFCARFARRPSSSFESEEFKYLVSWTV